MINLKQTEEKTETNHFSKRHLDGRFHATQVERTDDHMQLTLSPAADKDFDEPTEIQGLCRFRGWSN